MGLFIAGIALGVLTVAGIIVIFVFLAKKQEHLKELPKWVYVMAIILLVCMLASIGMVFGGAALKSIEANKSAIGLLNL